mmetsp:Transcript_1787/g.5438  ORF Transcript_1787/g.5438 Transcript_1787/m.5438 type:complete len:232 (+) Transcript_1787:180-875(+)
MVKGIPVSGSNDPYTFSFSPILNISRGATFAFRSFSSSFRFFSSASFCFANSLRSFSSSSRRRSFSNSPGAYNFHKALPSGLSSSLTPILGRTTSRSWSQRPKMVLGERSSPLASLRISSRKDVSASKVGPKISSFVSLFAAALVLTAPSPLSPSLPVSISVNPNGAFASPEIPMQFKMYVTYFAKLSTKKGRKVWFASFSTDATYVLNSFINANSEEMTFEVLMLSKKDS